MISTDQPHVFFCFPCKSHEIGLFLSHPWYVSGPAGGCQSGKGNGLPNRDVLSRNDAGSRLRHMAGLGQVNPPCIHIKDLQNPHAHFQTSSCLYMPSHDPYKIPISHGIF